MSVDDAGIFGLGGELSLFGFGGGQLGLELLDVIFGFDQFGLEHRHLVLEGAGINFEQRLARFDVLAFVDVDLDDLSGHLRCHLHDIGLDVRVGGQGSGSVAPTK